MSSIDKPNNKKKLFYHYTTQKGLLGIIKKKELWCTSIKYLNDSKEFNYTYDLFDKILEKQIQEKEDLVEKKFLECIRNDFFKTRVLDASRVYVCSFCQDKGDTLSQWRGYCSPNISGFSIGFSLQQIKKFLKMDRNLSFRKCIYEEDIQEDKINKLIGKVLNDLKPYNNELQKVAGGLASFSSKISSMKETHDIINYFLEGFYKNENNLDN